MSLKGIFNKRFSDRIYTLIRDPIVIGLLLLFLLGTKLLEGLLGSPTLPIVSIIIIFEEFLILIFIIDYTIEVVTELVISVKRNIKRVQQI